MPRRSRRAAWPLHFFVAAAVVGIVVLAAGLGSAPSNAQSFSCRHARYADEKTVCHDPSLGQLDQQLAAVYRRVMLKLPRHEAERLDKNEDLFVIARHRCGEDRACIEQSYRNRIQELQSALSEEAPDQKSELQAQSKPSDLQQATSDETTQKQPNAIAPSGGTNWINPARSR